MTDTTGRRVRANISLTLDGRYHGPGGPGDLGAIVPYVTTDVARGQLARIQDGATTAVLGRAERRRLPGLLGVRSPRTRTPTPATAATPSGWSAPTRWSSRPR